jgi:AraC-like DNA-binding protein
MDAPFRIWPLRTAEDERTYRGSAAAHRHDYQEIIVLTKGSGQHRIDWQDKLLAAPQAILVAQGKEHDFTTRSGARGWVLDFHSDFLCQPPSWLFSQFYALSEVSLADPALRKGVITLCVLMEDLHRSGPDGLAPIAHLLAALLAILQASVLRLVIQGRPRRASDFALFLQFMATLDAHFRGEKRLAFYARALRVNPRRLGAICKQALGRTPLALLEERSMIEARRLLAQTGLTVQQVGFDLGYEDPSYFTKAFRKVVRQTPSQFRREHALPGA